MMYAELIGAELDGRASISIEHHRLDSFETMDPRSADLFINDE